MCYCRSQISELCDNSGEVRCMWKQHILQLHVGIQIVPTARRNLLRLRLLTMPLCSPVSLGY
jgi:hypothetical protein